MVARGANLPVQVIDQVVDRLLRRFQPEKIILLGSHARGQANADSDLDFLVIMPEGTDRTRAAIEMHRELRDLPMPKDIVVSTPSDVSALDKHQYSIVGWALAEVRSVYERRNSEIAAP